MSLGGQFQIQKLTQTVATNHKLITARVKSNKLVTYNFLKDFTNKRKKAYKIVVFSHTPLPNIPEKTIEIICETF